MNRHCCHPRIDWREKVEALGLTYHSHEQGAYWDESACYELTGHEVNELETAANTLHYLCLEAAEVIIRRGWWDRLAIPEKAIESIVRSWELDDFSLYSRFDFAYDGVSGPKLLEYNADTPTALIEASVVQWFWLQEVQPGADQFNSLHERLIEAWRGSAGKTIHFSSIKEHPEDEQTVLYLRDTCEQAGARGRSVYVEDIGWDRSQKRFVDLDAKPIEQCFKLYPWEWLWHEDFAPFLAANCVQFIEPPWKMLLSNKGLLPILWEIFPDNPNLLPAFESPENLREHHIRKPKLSREGSNISWIEAGVAVEETTGDYGEDGYIYQALAPLRDFQGHHPVFGVWVVDHEAAGLGIREDTNRITTNLSRFVPHFFK